MSRFGINESMKHARCGCWKGEAAKRDMTQGNSVVGEFLLRFHAAAARATCSGHTEG
ncbi:hypothetical protein [Neoaquamicrobium sediminum]|uniref:Uncharacterized protein n=1 Tax=Neoaquamicrobium sediminum TaxID=1849104 RepID=A0ABV3WSW3_9HYPH